MNENIQNWSLGADKPPRPEQIKICNEIQSALDCEYKNIILEAGTGIGKSAMSTTIALNNPRSYILTMTKQLQDQYYNDFEEMVKQIKGRNAYTCNTNPILNCDEGNCQTIPKWKYKQACKECKYRIALEQAKSSEICLTNYDYLYYAGNYAGQFDTRNLLILDEAHNFETKMMSLISVQMSRNQIYQDLNLDIFYPIVNGDKTLKSLEEPEFWIEQAEYFAAEYIAKLHKLIDSDDATQKSIMTLSNKIKKYQSLIKYLSSKNNRWIIELPTKKAILKDKLRFKNGSKRQGYYDYLNVNFKPLYISDYSDELLQYGDHRLFMTGTLGSLSDFCRWNGLDEEETYYIYHKSPFHVENRHIYRTYAGSMARKNYDETLPRAKQMVKEILAKYPNDKGVIHVSSYSQAKDLENVDSRIFVHNNKEREQAISFFERTNEPKVLVSPSIKDGVDFKGDKCRFQIIYKMPYPSLGSKQTMIKVHHDQRWYNYNTVMPLMQAYGRGIRDSEDYCDVYILDSEFSRLYNQNEDLFNEYFKEALITVPRQKGLSSIVPAGERIITPVMKEVKVPVQTTFSVTGGLQIGK